MVYSRGNRVMIHNIILMILIPQVLSEAARGKGCVCDLRNTDPPFPDNRLKQVETGASQCAGTITAQKMIENDRLVLGLQQRIRQLEDDVFTLEKEDNRRLYGAVSLRIIELELAEIHNLLDKLNRSTSNYQHLSVQTTAQLQEMQNTMVELEKFDNMQVIKKKREKQQINRNIKQCIDDLKATPATPSTNVSPLRHCGLGQLVNVSGPKTYSVTAYGTSYPYGAWGRDANPGRGDEKKYWLVVLSSSNVYGHFVRQYGTLSTLLLGIGQTDTYIAQYNPTTNTIQGPNMVMYGNELYYNCYNSASVCRFNMTTRAVSTAALPKDAGYNNQFPFAHLGATYGYSDMDFATDESGVYVMYATTSNFGNIVIGKVETGAPPVLGQTWSTSLYKKTATNTFVVCGVLFATRYVDRETEEIFYAYDTRTKTERFDLKIHIKKMRTNIQFLNYDHRDRLLYVYSDAYIVTYEVIFQ